MSEYCTSWGTQLHITDDGERTLCDMRAGQHPIDAREWGEPLCEKCEQVRNTKATA